MSDEDFLASARETHAIVSGLPEPEERVRLRRVAGYSQAQLAAHIGVTSTTFRGYELGRRVPRGWPLIRLARFYDECREGATV